MLNDDFPMMMEREFGMPENVPPVGVAFGLYPHIDSKKSQEAGHDVYKDVEYVKIVIPGDRNSMYFQPAEDGHRKRFPQAYAAFKSRDTKPRGEGMPIEEWAPISRSLALNLRSLHIDTVEALAEVHDGYVDRIGSNGRELREKARAWKAKAKDDAANQKLASEKQALQDQIAALQAQMAALQQQVGTPAINATATIGAVADPTASVEQDVVAAARTSRRRA